MAYLVDCLSKGDGLDLLRTPDSSNDQFHEMPATLHHAYEEILLAY